MERVEIPKRRMITLGDDVERLLVARRNKGAAGLALVKELVLGDLVGLGVMRDEDDFDVAVAGRDELVKQEEEAAREILLHRVHRARGVHDANDGRVRFLADVGLEMLVTQIILMERKTTLVAVGILGRFEPLGFAAMLRRQHALDALTRRAPLVQPHADADVAITLALGETVRLDFAQRAPFEIRQFEILEHDLDQLVERDVGLVVVNARTIAGLAVALSLAVLAGLADHLPRLRIAVALSDAGSVIAVDEAVFLDPAQGDLDDLVLVFADDRFFGDDVGDVLADRFAYFLAMAQAIARRSIRPLGIGDAVFAK